MGSCSSPDNEQHQYHPQPQRPQFFKVFLPEHCSLTMRIPDSFVARITEKIPKKVVLQIRNGKFWTVEVAELGNGLYFQEGWPKFVVNNSLSVGEFMTFDYNGHHVFDVTILGINGCERDPNADEEEEEEEEEEEDKEDEDKDEDDDNDEGKFRTMLDKNLMSNGSEEKFAMKKNLAENGEEDNQEGIDTTKLAPHEEVIDTTKSVPHRNPSFVRKVTQRKFGSLFIPKPVIDGYDLKFGNSIFLQDAKGRRWWGKICKYQQDKVWVTKGWKYLCRKNKVREGDTIIHEFLLGKKGTCKTIKVNINRGKEA